MKKRGCQYEILHINKTATTHTTERKYHKQIPNPLFSITWHPGFTPPLSIKKCKKKVREREKEKAGEKCLGAGFGAGGEILRTIYVHGDNVHSGRVGLKPESGRGEGEGETLCTHICTHTHRPLSLSLLAPQKH